MAAVATVECARCGRSDAPALARPPLPGKPGAEIQQRVCAGCWADWQRAEVMVINELRLNFMDPAAQEILNRHMREFLFPGSAEESRPEPG
jgi:Fe-S cluster biosynthesis and repair protein YggX